MSDELVHAELEAGVLTLTLDSPANRNALSAQLVGELTAGLDRAASDAAVRVVVLAHTGNTFCAGADLAESAREGGPSKGTRRLVDLLRAILSCPRPVVASIDGNVRAGGLGIVGACDVVLVGRISSFAFTEARLGLAPAIISLTVLPRLTDRAASQYFLTGERFDAGEAERIGLVTQVADDVTAALAGYLEAFRACSPQGLAESKALTTASVLAAIEDRADALAARSGELFASAEAQEGIASFLEKRPPNWAIG